MAEFTLHCAKATGETAVFYYDNETSALLDSFRNPVEIFGRRSRQWGEVFAVAIDAPGAKRDISVLKIQLGLNCNYACAYCSQRFVPRADPTGPDHVGQFMGMLPADIRPGRIEFWGGEPFVYWKTLKPLAEALRGRFPDARFSIVTNGSMLDAAKNAWLDRLGFDVAISHDGPGQPVRGPDPFDTEVAANAIRDLYGRLHPQGRISFNAMLNRHNTSRAAINAWFVERLGDPTVVIGEGGFVDPYDAAGRANSLAGEAAAIAFRRQALDELRNASARNMSVNFQRIGNILDAIATGRPAKALGQKCGMDRPGHLAVDLEGHVLTCQNVSRAATAPNGRPHRIGHIGDLDAVRLDTATHWSRRPECQNCPVLQSCQGGCMFLEGDLWEAGCDNAFSDHIPYFAAAIELITGYLPVWIDGPQRPDRRDVFGLLAEQAAGSET